MKQLTFLIIWATICLWFTACGYKKADPEIHLIPNEYSGPVLIIFSDSIAQPLTYEHEARVYMIPENGVLRTKTSPNEGMIPEEKIRFFYITENGSRVEIKKALLTGQLEEDVKYVFNPQIGVAYSNTDGSERPYKSYLISIPSRRKDVFNRLTTLEDSVLFE